MRCRNVSSDPGSSFRAGTFGGGGAGGLPRISRITHAPRFTGVVVVLPSLFMGSLIIEAFFGIPGLGNYTIEGIALPATTTENAYADTPFRSTNRETASVDAGMDQSVRPGAAVTLNAAATNPNGAGLIYAWTQTAGTTVALASNGPTATFTAPSRIGALQFRVTVADGSPELPTDTVTMNVTTGGPVTVAWPDDRIYRLAQSA